MAARKEIRIGMPVAPAVKMKNSNLQIPPLQILLDSQNTVKLTSNHFQDQKNEVDSDNMRMPEMTVVRKAKVLNLKSLFIKANDQIINLKLNDILWVEAYGDYVNFVTEKTKYLVHGTMKAIENRLPEEQFVRVHRSFIIRAEKIDLIEESLIQIGKKLIPIGESYRQNLLSRLDIL